MSRLVVGSLFSFLSPGLFLMLTYTWVEEAKYIFFCFADPSIRTAQFDYVSLEVADPGSLQMLTYTRVGEGKKRTNHVFFFYCRPQDIYYTWGR